MQDANHVHRNVATDLVWVGGRQRADRGDHTSIVDPQIDAAETGDHVVDKRSQPVVVGDVHGGPNGCLSGNDASLSGRGPGGHHQAGTVAGAQPEMQPGRREVHRQAGAEPAAGSGDDRDLAGDIEGHDRAAPARLWWCSAAASTSARKGRASLPSSGCHCTPITKVAERNSTASMTPSAARAVTSRPAPSSAMAWWCEQSTVGSTPNTFSVRLPGVGSTRMSPKTNGARR